MISYIVKAGFRDRHEGFEVTSIFPASKKMPVSITNFDIASQEFPVCTVRMETEKSDERFARLQRGNQLTLSLSQDGSDFREIFVGEITKLQTHTKKDYPDEITVWGQSPFFRLQQTFLFDEHIRICSGFRSLVKRIMQVGAIWGTVLFDEDVRDDIDLWTLQNFPAYMLLKQISFQRDLIFMIQATNEMTISNRSTFIQKSMSNIRTISEDDMLSLTIEK